VIGRPHDLLDVLKVVTGRLEAARIPYMITGSIASGHYGHPRMTRDIDIVVEVTAADAARLASALGEEFGAEAERIREAIGRQSLFNVIHRDAIVKVDFVVRKDTAYRVEEFRRRRRVAIDGHDVWIVTPEDLILSKLVWAKESRSELQVKDIRAVLAFQQGTLDRGYLIEWAERLSVASYLDEVES
jgi:hypothetical protein